jgi:hypothetical protein
MPYTVRWWRRLFVKELQGADTEMLDALRKDEEVKRRSMEVDFFASPMHFTISQEGANRCLQHYDQPAATAIPEPRVLHPRELQSDGQCVGYVASPGARACQDLRAKLRDEDQKRKAEAKKKKAKDLWGLISTVDSQATQNAWHVNGRVPC